MSPKPRRSPRKKQTGPPIVIDSDDDVFVTIEAEDRYYLSSHLISPKHFHLVLCSLDGKDNIDIFQEIDHEEPECFLEHKEDDGLGWQGTSIKAVKRYCPTTTTDSEDDRSVYIRHVHCLSDLIFHSINITPPPTPSPVKVVSGKKRAIALSKSEEDDAFIPRYVSI